MSRPRPPCPTQPDMTVRLGPVSDMGYAMAELAVVLTLASAIGAGIACGFFYAFSGLVMPALARRPAPEAVAAMQAINVVVLNPAFFALFFGTAALGLAAAVAGCFVLPGAKAAAAVASALVYAVGCVGATIVRNVPLNEELKAASPSAPATEALWRRYLTEWTWWNHVRTIACLVASAGFTLVLV